MVTYSINLNMKTTQFNQLIKSPTTQLQHVTKTTLNSWLKKFPYCEIIYQIDLLKAKKNNDIDFDEKIRTASVYSKNRKNLFLLINPNNYKNNKKNSKKSMYSFTDWLKNSKSNSKKKEPELITQKNIKKSIEHNDNLTTETLAKIYAEQGHYERAIQAYKILCLKYPKKSGFFADQINFLKQKIT